jgi:hypothetical protein
MSILLVLNLTDVFSGERVKSNKSLVGFFDWNTGVMNSTSKYFSGVN